ncbi:MAG: alpha/beta hydrolase [Paludibacter sp.]|nr:alpha/beta hydrolase [Paludibacter sp.]
MTFIINTTISKDGTKIGYRQIGTGPGLIICHGGGRISQNYEKLALALSDRFTVYVPDRRGRGLSGQEGENYNILKAAEDLISVIQATSASFIFGHSAGAIVALEAFLTHPVNRLAVYEPPISVNNSFPLGWLSDFEVTLKKSQRKKAMAISLKGLNVIEGVNKMPLWLILFLINVLTLFEINKEKGTRMLDLLPTLTADIKMAKTLDSKFEKYHKIEIPVNLMTGSKSPEYFRVGLEALSDVLKHPETKIFEGFNHYSPEENVIEISIALKEFFKQN